MPEETDEQAPGRILNDANTRILQVEEVSVGVLGDESGMELPAVSIPLPLDEIRRALEEGAPAIIVVRPLTPVSAIEMGIELTKVALSLVKEVEQEPVETEERPAAPEEDA